MSKQIQNGDSYPLLLRLTGRRCVVVGGGKVAERKVRDLLAAGALVTVISPAFTAGLDALAAEDSQALTLVREPFSPELLPSLSPLLVFAATNQREINQQVAEAAHAIDSLVDVVDAASEGDFASMQALRRGPVTIAIATGGASPTLAVHLRDRIAALVGEEYGILAQWLADLRSAVRTQVHDEAERRALWQSILRSPALDLLRQGDESGAWDVVQKLVSRVDAAKDAKDGR